MTSIEDETNYLIKYIGNDTELILPNNYNGETYDIYNYAFTMCRYLTSISIPNVVTIIGDNAFKECYSLYIIILPNSITSIGDSVFSGCNSLNFVYYTGSVIEWNDISIVGWNNYLLEHRTKYYYSETQPTDTTYKY